MNAEVAKDLTTFLSEALKNVTPRVRKTAEGLAINVTNMTLDELRELVYAADLYKCTVNMKRSGDGQVILLASQAEAVAYQDVETGKTVMVADNKIVPDVKPESVPIKLTIGATPPAALKDADKNLRPAIGKVKMLEDVHAGSGHLVKGTTVDRVKPLSGNATKDVWVRNPANDGDPIKVFSNEATVIE